MNLLTIISLIVFIILYYLFRREYLSLNKLYIFAYKFKIYLRKKIKKTSIYMRDLRKNLSL